MKRLLTEIKICKRTIIFVSENKFFKRFKQYL